MSYKKGLWKLLWGDFWDDAESEWQNSRRRRRAKIRRRRRKEEDTDEEEREEVSYNHHRTLTHSVLWQLIKR